jgi:hypothetical protein
MNAPLWPSAADEFQQQDGDFMAAHPELFDGWLPDPIYKHARINTSTRVSCLYRVRS